MKNSHSRYFHHPPESIRPWIDFVWSGTDRDLFPRDFIPSRRSNPKGAPPLALIPGVTRLGHGPFDFVFRKWDGSCWEVDFSEKGKRVGWHGFDLIAAGAGSRLVHMIKADFPWLQQQIWSLFIQPIHDWVIEAIFDRLAVALETGQVPDRTARPMPPSYAACSGLFPRRSIPSARPGYRRHLMRRTGRIMGDRLGTLSMGKMTDRRASIFGIFLAAAAILIATLFPKQKALDLFALLLVLIAAVYLGFALLDGRRRELSIEIVSMTFIFFLSALGLWVTPIFLVIGYVAHGLWDILHHPKGIQTKVVRWWPPFCVMIDWIVAGFIFFRL